MLAVPDGGMSLAAVPPVDTAAGVDVEFWATIIAAITGGISAIVAITALVLAWRWNADAARRDKVAEAALDTTAVAVSRLTSVTESSVNEARELARRLVPRPRVVGLTPDSESTTLFAQLGVPTRIVQDEILVEATKLLKARRPQIADVEAMKGAKSASDPVSRDGASYDRDARWYLFHLKHQLSFRQHYENYRARLVAVRFRVHNDGAVPIDEGWLRLTLPEGLSPQQMVEPRPEVDEPPSHGDGRARLAPPLPRGDDSASSIGYGLSTGFQVLRGGNRLEWRFGDLLHGQSTDTPPVIAHVSQSGRYELVWHVHAANLHEPASGSVPFLIEDPEDDTTPVVIRTLRDVGALKRAVEDELHLRTTN
jgi:hypothetical protein